MEPRTQSGRRGWCRKFDLWHVERPQVWFIDLLRKMYCLLRIFAASSFGAARTTAEVGFPKQFNAASSRCSLFWDVAFATQPSRAPDGRRWMRNQSTKHSLVRGHAVGSTSLRVPYQVLNKPGYSSRLALLSDLYASFYLSYWRT